MAEDVRGAGGREMMETVFGPVRVVDAHVHFFSRAFYSFFLEAANRDLGRTDSYEDLARRLGWDLPGPDPGDLAGRWAEDLRRSDVDRAVLIASLGGDQESVRRAVDAHPDRFIGYFMVDPTKPGVAGLVRDTLRHPGMRGVCLFPAMHRFALDDPRLSPILEEAEARRAIVFVHCGVLKVGIRDRLGLSSPFDLRLGNPLDLQATASRHRRTAFVIPHFGAGFWRETLMVGSMCPNVFVDTSSSNEWMKTQAEPVNLSRVLARTVGVFGPDRVLFGTDSSFFPRGYRADILESQLRAMLDLGLAEPAVRSILGGNLERLLAID